MQAEILSIGTELLLGDIVNTNAQYLSKKLAEMGIYVYCQAVVGDNPQRIQEAFENAFKKSDMIITTGGLGPTKDDLTKEMAAEYFGKNMVLDEGSLQWITNLFQKQNWKMSEGNKKQAYFPAESIILKNDKGTAPGCIIRENGKTAVLLPGPPQEMKHMFEKGVIPYLAQFQQGIIQSKVLHICGIGESSVAEIIADIIDAQTNPTVAPYAKDMEVTLRITAKARDKDEVNDLIRPVENEIRKRLGESLYGEGETTLENVIGESLVQKGLTISVAESCTGGIITARLVNYAGISSVLKEGAVTYSNDAKVRSLGVKEDTLSKFGAVSTETAGEMAAGIASVSNTDIGLSTTGIAGPAGGTPEKPVGLVYIGLYIKGETKVKKIQTTGDRKRVRKKTVVFALDWLRRELNQV
ncbi:MAG: competence/damage-inducible protein A [Clostridiales bacterium]|nr:competence/damage-inducible protein A [Clostridiales bacterium]MCF8022102.1 competence/damage-inducible protein A [Clostridiales bacterium]